MVGVVTENDFRLAAIGGTPDQPKYDIEAADLPVWRRARTVHASGLRMGRYLA
jgi:hypothetical protein